jgi:ATPases involved in chromosome partitioning
VNDQAKTLRKSFGAANGTVGTAGQGPHAPAAIRTELAKQACRIIAVTSGKGGVGKSNISLSLAIALSSLKKEVCIVDADLGLANIHLLLGIVPRRNLSNCIDEECELSEIIAHGPAGVHIIPGASGLEKLANLDPLRMGMLQRKLGELESQYDYMIIDTGAGIGKITVEFASKADMAVVVLTPEPASFADAYAMVKVLYDKKITRLAALVNMVSSDAEGKETFDKLNTLVVKFLKRPLELIGILPFDKQVSLLAKRQKMVLMENPRSLFAGRMAAIARTISGVQASRREGFFARLFKL